MTQWPDPPPSESGISARVWLAAALAAVGAFFGWRMAVGDGAAWRMPELHMPELNLPQVSLPDMRLPDLSAPQHSTPESDLRGRADPPVDVAENDPVAALVESLMPSVGDGVPSVQSVPFETCSSMLDDFAGFGGPPIVVEDTDERRVRRYKFAQGDLTVTCTRAENTMRIETRD